MLAQYGYKLKATEYVGAYGVTSTVDGVCVITPIARRGRQKYCRFKVEVRKKQNNKLKKVLQNSLLGDAFL